MTGGRTSVVVCTRRRPEELERCLRSLAELVPSPREIIVVDNHPDGESALAIADRLGARHVAERRSGISQARNTGALSARGELVAFIDDDATADPSWLRDYEAAFDDPAVGAAAGRVLPIDSDLPQERRHEGDLGTDPRRIDRETPQWFERTNFGGGGLGPNLMFRRSLFENGFRFDERLGVGTLIPGNEEHYAFFDVVRRGHVLAYVPTAIVRHGAATMTAAAARERRRRILRASTAFMVMLLVEEPGHRREMLRYLATASPWRSREWRGGPPLAANRGARLDLLQAAAAGPVLYARTRLRSARPRLRRAGRPARRR